MIKSRANLKRFTALEGDISNGVQAVLKMTHFRVLRRPIAYFK